MPCDVPDSKRFQAFGIEPCAAGRPGAWSCAVLAEVDVRGLPESDVVLDKPGEVAKRAKNDRYSSVMSDSFGIPGGSRITRVQLVQIILFHITFTYIYMPILT